MDMYILWKLVLKKHNETHWGVEALCKYLKEVTVSCDLYSRMKQVIQQCEICLKNSPNTRTGYEWDLSGQGMFQENNGK